MFRVFSAVFLCFSRVSAGLESGKKSLVFWVVFLGFLPKHQGMEDQGGVNLRENLRSSAKISVLGLVCHLSSFPLSTP